MATIGHKVSKIEIFLNEKDERCAQDEQGVWRRVGEDDKLLSFYAKQGLRPAYPKDEAVLHDAERIAADLETLKREFESFQKNAASHDELDRLIEELRSLAKQVGTLRVALGDIDQIEALVKNAGDQVGQSQALRERIDLLEKKVDAAADAASKHFKDLDARVENLEKRSAAASAAPQSSASSPRDGARPTWKAFPTSTLLKGAAVAALILLVCGILLGYRLNSFGTTVVPKETLTNRESVAKADFDLFAGDFSAKWSDMGRRLDSIDARLQALDKGAPKQDAGAPAPAAKPDPPEPARVEGDADMSRSGEAFAACIVLLPASWCEPETSSSDSSGQSALPAKAPAEAPSAWSSRMWSRYPDFFERLREVWTQCPGKEQGKGYIPAAAWLNENTAQYRQILEACRLYDAPRQKRAWPPGISD